MSGPNLGAFTAFTAASLVLTFFAVRGSNFLYGKIGTCHPASWHVERDEDYERLFKKIWKLGVYNFIVVLTTVALILMYALSPIGSGFGLNVSAWFALATLSLVMNFSLRLGALADINTQFRDKILERCLSFGFSFILSIYFLMLFGVGSYVIQNGFYLEIDPGTVSFPQDLIQLFILLIVLGPWIAATISELLLHPSLFDVEQGAFDDLSEGR